ncbi:MAG: hypothetical protein QCI38_00810, partial [Candidatus Thermoplasmatota archaeon]|nr:hypothetical protein [Candidatus Thermoplasmatota archaeon]
MFKKGVFGNGLPVVINWTKKSLAILVVFTLCFTWSSSVSDAAVESFDFEDDGSHFLQHQYDDNIENWHEWWYTNLHWTVGEDEYDMICAFRTLGNLSNPVYNSFGCGAY